jgi:hypothetical protein
MDPDLMLTSMRYPREVGTSLVMQGKTEAGMQGKNRCTAAVGDLVVFLDGRK